MKILSLVDEHTGHNILYYRARDGLLNCIRLLVQGIYHQYQEDPDIYERNKPENVINHRGKCHEDWITCKYDARNDGTTALHQAAWEGYPDIARFLLENGAIADIDIIKSYRYAGDKGRTPVMFACSQNKVSSIEVLVEYGADVTRELEDKHDGTKRSCTWDAINHGSPDVLRYLVSNNITLHANELQHGKTMLTSIACCLGNSTYSIVQYILKNGGKIAIDNLDPRGHTALTSAAIKGYLDIVKVLVENGANITIKAEGYTALQWAEFAGHKDVEKYLGQL